MKTRITELFGIEHPVIQGGMHYVGLAEMAAAVSNAGGLGIITGLTQGTHEKLANEIARCQAMTDKPFGVNLTFLPSVTPPDYPGLVKTIIESGEIPETYGVPIEQVVEGIKHGVRKVNIDTDLRLASTGAIRRFLTAHPAEFDPRKYLAASQEAMKAICVDRYESFGAAGNASKIRPMTLDAMQVRYAH